MHNLLMQQLTRIFPGIETNTLLEILDSGKKIELKTGEYLFHQGEDKHELYIVLQGRLRAIEERGENTQILGDISAGETVGELAFFTGEPRMASVVAIRDTVVLEYTPAQYMGLMANKPTLAFSLIKGVIERIRQNAFESNKSEPPKNLALIKLHPEMEIQPWLNDLAKQLDQDNIPIQIYDQQSQSGKHREELFLSLEEHEGINLLVGDALDMEWTRQSLIYADIILVAADFQSDPELVELERLLQLYSGGILDKRTYLLLFHPENGHTPDGTHRWLENRPVDMHIHIRYNHLRDLQRFCRIMTHKAVGLVLGGGGAKGFAHIGAVQALCEAGIPIDFLGGTSAGALYGIGMSFADFDFERIHALNQEAVRRKMTTNQLTLPMVSLMSGKKFKKYLKELYGNHRMEDIWTRSYCLSTDFSKAEAYIHDSGPIWKQVLASMAIPGIFPPVVINKHLHVDGGVMDNMPIEPMYRFPVDTIIAISLTHLHVREVNYEDLPNAWELLRKRIHTGKKSKIPGIASLIIHSITINSQQKQEAAKAKVSHFIELDLKGIGMLEDKRWREIMQKGYEQTKAYLASSLWKG